MMECIRLAAGVSNKHAQISQSGVTCTQLVTFWVKRYSYIQNLAYQGRSEQDPVYG
jgi:hypothetical protein